MLQKPRHGINFGIGQLTRGAPVGHAGGRTEVDQRLEIVAAFFLGNVGGQRLAGGPLAQYAMTAGAALKVNLFRALELYLNHVGLTWCNHALAAIKRRRTALGCKLGFTGAGVALSLAAIL